VEVPAGLTAGLTAAQASAIIGRSAERAGTQPSSRCPRAQSATSTGGSSRAGRQLTGIGRPVTSRAIARMPATLAGVAPTL
jgi:hypothetical protein